MKSIYTVFDSKADSFSPPVVYDNDQVAMRACGHALLSGDSPVSNFPRDYSLFRIGVFDEDGGAVEGTDRVHIGTLEEIRDMLQGPAMANMANTLDLAKELAK